MTPTEQPSRWPIRQVRSVFVLEDARTGQRISWHKTVSGALRKRREIIELRDHLTELFMT